MDPLLEDLVPNLGLSLTSTSVPRGIAMVQSVSRIRVFGMKVHSEAVISPVWLGLYLIVKPMYKIWVQILASITI